MNWTRRINEEPEFRQKKNLTSSGIDFDNHYVEKFLADWNGCRKRHKNQQKIIDDFREKKYRYMFLQAGRKFSKTTTIIDIAWLYCNTNSNIVCYIGFPSIKQGVDVIWDEKRAQYCDIKETYMYDRYVAKTDDTRHILTFQNGSWVKLIGTWVENSGRGTQPDMLMFDEVQDCDPDYIEAMDPNLAAKESSFCLMSGTPPKTPGHYQEWRERIKAKESGIYYHYTSYDNESLPHLKKWLDDKKIELEKAGKSDVWLREYMAEDCFISADRVLPDPLFEDRENVLKIASNFSYKDRIPILAISAHRNYVCVMLAILCAKKMLCIMDQYIEPEIWKSSFSDIYSKIGEKIKDLRDFCGQKVRQVVWDESETFAEIVSGIMKCRKDLKWEDRGIPLLREMIVRKKIFFTRDVGDFGIECQKMLMDETIKDVKTEYPMICTLSMLVNEYFQKEKIVIDETQGFDKYAGLREMGIPCPPKKSIGKRLFQIGF